MINSSSHPSIKKTQGPTPAELDRRLMEFTAATFGHSTKSKPVKENKATPIIESPTILTAETSSPAIVPVPLSPRFIWYEADGTTPATPEQCCSLLTRASKASAIVMLISDNDKDGTGKVTVKIGIHYNHPIPDGLLLGLQQHSAAISYLLRLVKDNYCPDCGLPRVFEVVDGKSIRVFCRGQSACGLVSRWPITK